MNNQTNILSSSSNPEKWIALEEEFPIPYMEVLFFSAKDYTYRVGYWDPIEEKVAISTVKMDRDNEETMLLSERISEANPKFNQATHWRYLPSQPVRESDEDQIPSEVKTMKELLNSELVEELVKEGSDICL